LGVAAGSAQVASKMTTGAPWIMTGVILAAQTGIDYRRYKNGEINET